MVTGEQVIWTGRPMTVPYRIRNIVIALIDFSKVALLGFAFFVAYYFLLQKSFFPMVDVYNFGLFLLIVFVVKMGELTRKMYNINQVIYYVTNKRLLVFSDQRAKVKIIKKDEIKSKQIIDSYLERKYEARTIKLILGDGELSLESIQNSEQVLALL